MKKKIPLVILKTLWGIISTFFSIIGSAFRFFINLFKKSFTVKNFFHYDNVLALLTLLLFFYSLKNINFEIINPIGDAFEDVELTDILFSDAKLEKNKDLRVGAEDNLVKINKDITLINIGNLRRDEVADVLFFVNSFKPKVVALDIFFEQPQQPAFLDAYLEAALDSTENLVFINRLEGFHTEEGEEFGNNYFNGKLKHSIKNFTRHGVSGFANMVLDERHSTHMNICREFMHSAIDTSSNDTLYSWSVEIIKRYKPEALERLFDRGKRIEITDYVGNIYVRSMLLPYEIDQTKEWEKPYFEAIDYSVIQEAMDTSRHVSLDSSLFKDKIILVGYLGNRIDVEETGEDLFYTPLNENYVGKAHKDMYGMVVHANIIDSILRNSYIDQSNKTFMHFVGFFLLYLVFVFYRPIYDDHKVWYDGVSKALGIGISLIIFFIIGIVFDWFNYRITLSAIWFGGILLAGDWLEIYYGLIKNLISKFRTLLLKKITQS